MIKLVADANTIISGMMGSESGASRAILNLALAKEVLIFGSQETYKEFCEKLKLPRIRRYLARRFFTPEKIILDYKSIVNIYEPFEILAGKIITRDPKDDIYFRVAKASGSSIIVSYDKDLLDLIKFDDIVAVSPGQFITSFNRLKSKHTLESTAIPKKF